MMAGLSTSSWAYNVATIRASDANSAATVAAFTGLPTTSITATFTQAVEMQNSNSSSTLQTSSIGIGLNSLTAYSGQVGTFGSIGSGATGLSSFGVATAILILQPTLGLNNFNQLEQGNATSSITNTFFGTNGDMQLTVSYRG
jgi:hypothetical protein